MNFQTHLLSGFRSTAFPCWRFGLSLAVLWPGNCRASWNGVWKPPFWKVLPASRSAKNMRFQCPCHVLALAALPKSLMRMPATVNRDTSCCGFCACEMNFLLIIKCSPTCGKLPFLGPFESDVTQSSFPRGTEETRSVVITQPSTLAASLLQEIIPSEMNFYISYQLTTCSWLPNFCQRTMMNILEWWRSLLKGARLGFHVAVGVCSTEPTVRNIINTSCSYDVNKTKLGFWSPSFWWLRTCGYKILQALAPKTSLFQFDRIAIPKFDRELQHDRLWLLVKPSEVFAVADSKWRWRRGFQIKHFEDVS